LSIYKGDPMENLLRCSKCGQYKNPSEFIKDKNTTRGYVYMCKPCWNEYYEEPKRKDKRRAYQRERNKKLYSKNRDEILKKAREKNKQDPEAQMFRMYKYKYGLTREDYIKLMENQGGSCAICGNKFSESIKAHVDHCHTTDVVRGLLCGACNRGIGLLKEDPKIFQSAADYLYLH